MESISLPGVVFSQLDSFLVKSYGNPSNTKHKHGINQNQGLQNITERFGRKVALYIIWLMFVAVS